MKQAKKQSLFKIIAPKLKVKTKGFINLISKSKAEVETKAKKVNVKIYKNKLSLILGKGLFNAKRHLSSLFGNCFTKASRLESCVQMAKKALQNAKKGYLTTVEYFQLHVGMAKALIDLRKFKYSLPNNIRINLF